MSFEKLKSVSQQEQKAEENAHIAVVLRSASAEKIAHFLKNGNEEQKRVCAEIDQEITLIDQKIASRESALHATNDTAGDMTTKKEDLETYRKEKSALVAKRKEYADEAFKNIDQQSLRNYIEAHKGENINNKKEELQELQKEIVRLQGIVGMENRYDSKKQFDANDVAQGKFEGEKKKLMKYEQDAQRLSDDIKESEKIGLVLSLFGEKSGKEDAKDAEKTAVVENVTDVQKESRDTDMDEVDKFDREVQRRENVAAETNDIANFQREWDDIAAAKKEAYNGKKIEIRHEKIEEMRAILAQKRELFVRKDMAINTALAKLRKLPWNKDGNLAAQEEVQVFRKDYEAAFKALENFLLDNYNELSPEDRKNLVQDIVEGRNTEVASLQEQRTQIKSESTPIMQKYLPTFSKWARNKNVQKALAVGSIGLGAISGSVRTAFSMAPKIALKLGAGETTMSALKFTAAASKFLAPVGAGVAVGMGTAKLFEKWQKSRFEKEKLAEKKTFAEMTEEEQFLRLMDFDHGTIVNDAKRLEAISGNAKLAGLITGAIAGGSVFMLMGGDVHGAEDIVKSDASVDQAFLDRAGKPLLDVEQKTIDPTEVQTALRNTAVTDAWLNQYTSYDEHLQKFQASGFQDSQAYADFQKEYNAEAFKRFVEEHPNTPRQEVINNWEKGMIARSNMIADRVQLEHDTKIAQNIAKEMHIAAQNPTLDIHEGSVTLNGQPVPKEIWEKQGHTLTYLENDASIAEQTTNTATEAFKGVSIFVEKGSSVQGALTRFLEDDGVRLSEVMSTWKDASVRDLAQHALTLDHDSKEYHDAIHKLAEIRSSVLSNEFAKSHPGIDLNSIQPDTRLILDTRNAEDMKLDIDFKGGPHIVPEKTKIEFSQEASDAHLSEIGKELYTKNDIQKMFGMNEEQYAFFDHAPADQYFKELQHVDPDKAQSDFDRIFVKIANEKGAHLSGKTVMEVLRTHEIDSLQNPVAENAVKIETPTAPVENVHGQAEQPVEVQQKQDHTMQNGEERVVRRSKNADEFFSRKEGARIMSTGFSFTPDTPAGDIAKELTQRGVDEEYARKLASEYKNDTSIFGDAMEKRQAMMKLNMKLREHFESNGKSFYDSAREIKPEHDVRPSVDQDHGKNIRRSPHAEEFMKNGAGALREKAQLSQTFAERMGEKDVFNVKAKFQGGVPVEINGKPVPEELYTPEQLKRVHTARHLNDLMSQREGVGQNVQEGLDHMRSDKYTEIENLRTLSHNPEFVSAVKGEVKNVFGADMRNVGGMRMDFAKTHLVGRVDSLDGERGLLARVREHLGEDALPKNNPTISTYFMRTFARAAQEDKLREVFPSSHFTV